MKTKSLFLGVLLCVALAAPAFAQSPQTERKLQQIMQRHPALAANPSLVNNPQWQKQHPNVWTWFQDHPAALRQTSQAGAWERNGTWHNQNWWFQNNPNWVYQNHPEWIQGNPGWRQSGDWDADDHTWHNRDWYMQNRREWAEHHHPEWAHREEEENEHQGPPYGNAWGHYKHHHHDHDND